MSLEEQTFDTEAMSSLSVEDLMKLEQMVFNDLLKRQLRISYSVRDQMFTFATLDQASNFLTWLRGEISVRQSGGGFSLATFTGA